MKLFLLSIIVFTLGCDKSPTLPASEDPSGLNLDFEQVGARNRPVKWYVSAGKSYRVDLDSGVAFSGRRSLRITFLQQAEDDASFVWISKLPVDQVRGRKVTYTGYIRTAELTDGSACLWFRVDGPSDSVLAFDTMDVHGVSGTTAWKQYTIELSVDSSAINTDFGVRHDGKGIAWFDKFEILIDGKPYKRQVFTATDEQIEWLKEEAHPFNTPLVGSGFEDLAFVKDIVGDAEIVGLGEATHGTKEFFQMKHRLTEYLASSAGFTVFAIEAGMPEADMINDFVLGGPGNIRELMKELSVFWNTKEVESMIEWMRAFNTSGKGISNLWVLICKQTLLPPKMSLRS